MEISAPLKTPLFPSPARHSPSPLYAPRFRLAMTKVAMAAETRSPRLSADATLLSGDPRRREDVLLAAVESLSNCLSETHLDKTVPGLKSKARGKVSCSLLLLWFL
jgi:hypothetical protein